MNRTNASPVHNMQACAKVFAVCMVFFSLSSKYRYWGWASSLQGSTPLEPGLLPALMVLSQRSSESPVLTRNPEFLGGYVRGPFLPGPLIPLLVAAGALWVVGDNALELLQ